MFGVDHRGGFTVGWIPKGKTLPGSSALSVGKILFTAKVGNRSEARAFRFFELLNTLNILLYYIILIMEARNSSYFLFSKAGA